MCVGFVCEYDVVALLACYTETKELYNQQLQVWDAIVIRVCGMSHATLLNSVHFTIDY